VPTAAAAAVAAVPGAAPAAKAAAPGKGTTTPATRQPQWSCRTRGEGRKEGGSNRRRATESHMRRGTPPARYQGHGGSGPAERAAAKGGSARPAVVRGAQNAATYFKREAIDRKEASLQENRKRSRARSHTVSSRGPSKARNAGGGVGACGASTREG